MPPDSGGYRRFCSTSCRVRHWDTVNQPGDDDEPSYYGKHIRGHMHHGPTGTVLIGHRDSVQWHGDACPPECPGLPPGETYEPPVWP